VFRQSLETSRWSGLWRALGFPFVEACRSQRRVNTDAKGIARE
jgi:hypothetical protein